MFDAGGEKVKAAGTQPGIPADPSDADIPEGEKPDRKSGIWDNDWADSRYYWTAVPVIPVITPDAKVEYRDVEFAEDMCQAGQVINFGKTSAPAIERANGVPYASGMVGDGQIRGAQNGSPSFYGRLVIAWRPAPGAARYQVEWSKKANPFKAAGSVTTPSDVRPDQSRRRRLVLPRPRRRQDAADQDARHDLVGCRSTSRCCRRPSRSRSTALAEHVPSPRPHPRRRQRLVAGQHALDDLPLVRSDEERHRLGRRSAPDR